MIDTEAIRAEIERVKNIDGRVSVEANYDKLMGVDELAGRHLPEALAEIDRLYALLPDINTLARQTALTGYELWHSTLVGNAPSRTRELHQRMSRPRPGDLVLETSTIYRRMKETPYDSGGLGRLVRIEQRPYVTPGQWNYGGESDWAEYDEERDAYWQNKPYSECPKWEYFVIHPLVEPDKTVAWHNARFIAIPDRPVDDWLEGVRPMWEEGWLEELQARHPERYPDLRQSTTKE